MSDKENKEECQKCGATQNITTDRKHDFHGIFYVTLCDKCKKEIDGKVKQIMDLVHNK